MKKLSVVAILLALVLLPSITLAQTSQPSPSLITRVGDHISQFIESINRLFGVSGGANQLGAVGSVNDPVFDYPYCPATHRIYINFPAAVTVTEVATISTPAGLNNCYALDLTKNDLPMVDPCVAKSYTAGATCGIYLQNTNTKPDPDPAKRCVVRVSYQQGANTVSRYFESLGFYGQERIREFYSTP